MPPISQKSQPPLRMPRREKLPSETWLLWAFALGTTIMTFMAMLALITDQGLFGTAKAAFIAATAGLVSYSINRFAIEKGAYLAATGFALAGLVSIVSMLFVGGGLFASTYAGLTIRSVDELQLHDYAQDLNRFIGDHHKIASQATRAIPVISLISADLKAQAACEVKSSCLSGRPNGGYGPVAKVLEGVAARADEIAKQLLEGEASREATIQRLNRLIGDYQTILGETEKPLPERRQKLIGIDAEIDQALSRLDEAVPVALLQAYAKELGAGVSIAGQSQATFRVNALMAKHGGSLTSVLSTLDDTVGERPSFPAQAGVSATFAYITHFLPIAALTGCIELILPLSLWVFTYLGIVWDKHQRDPLHAVPVEADNPSVISAYELKIAKLEKQKLILAEKLQDHGKPKHSFEEMFELALRFLSNHWKLWVFGQLPLRNTVLRLAFAERMSYQRNGGFSNPIKSLPFNILGDMSMGKSKMAHLEGDTSNALFETLYQRSLTRAIPV